MIRMLIILVSLYLTGCSSVDSEKSKLYQPAQCDISKGCLNDLLIEAANNECGSESCETIHINISNILHKQFETAVLFRKYQFDLSKPCGKLKLSQSQRKLFDEACDYMLFSSDKSMLGYIRGSCFSGASTLAALENNIWFSNVDNSPIFNQVITGNQPFTLSKDANFIGLQMKENQSKEQSLSCFLSRQYQAP